MPIADYALNRPTAEAEFSFDTVVGHHFAIASFAQFLELLNDFSIALCKQFRRAVTFLAPRDFFNPVSINRS